MEALEVGADCKAAEVVLRQWASNRQHRLRGFGGAQGSSGVGWSKRAGRGISSVLMQGATATEATTQRGLLTRLTYGAQVVPMAVPVELSTEAVAKGFAPHIAELRATLLKGDT